MSILELMKIAAPAAAPAQPAAPAPPPNPVGGPTIMPRRGIAPVQPSAPTGGGATNAATPLVAQAPAAAAAAGPPAPYKGTMMLPQEMAMAQQADAEAAAEAAKHQPKAQAPTRPETPFSDQFLASYNERLDNLKGPMTKRQSAPISPEGLVAPTPFKPGGTADKVHGLARSILVSPLLKAYKAKTPMDRTIQNPQTPYGFALARGAADPVAVGRPDSSALRLFSNWMSGQADGRVSPEQIEGFATERMGLPLPQ